MISTKELEEALKSSESSILDFKRSFYHFENDKDLRNTAKFIKDVISFSNTIRKNKGLILFGIEEKEDKSLKIVGITNSVDDSILQEKVKDKVFPRPFFSYYEMTYEDKKIGVLEFPVSKYELPVMPVRKMKGLEKGKVYYRNGTSNTEANAIDIIRINNWFNTLSGDLSISLNDKISQILKRLTLNNEKLSGIITDILSIAKTHELTDLKSFCSAQIKGITEEEAQYHEYRIQKVYISKHRIDVNQNSLAPVTGSTIKREMEINNNFLEYKLLINHSITSLEELMRELSGGKILASVKLNSKYLFNEGNYDVYAFMFHDNIKNTYKSIRRKLIDEVFKIY